MVSVTCLLALAVFSCCAANTRLDGERPSVAGNTPSPINDALCTPALSVMLRLPFKVPDAMGWNATDTVHPTLGASDAPHVFAMMAKPVVTVGVPSVAGTPPVFEIVIFCAMLIAPTFVDAKLSVIGSRTIEAAVVPVPVSTAVACPPETFPYTVSKPERVPMAVGRNCTWTAQPVPTAMANPIQLLVWLKSPEVTTCVTVNGAFPEFVTVIDCAALALEIA